MRAFTIIALLGVMNCGGSTFPLVIGATVSGGAGVTTVAWNGVTKADGFDLRYPAKSSLRGEGLEFYSNGTRVPLAATTKLVTGDQQGPFNDTYYDARNLPDQRYTVVHRRSSGTPEGYTDTDEKAFTTFEGVPALVTTLEILRAADAGTD